MYKFLFALNIKLAIQAYSRAKAKPLYVKGTSKIYKGKYVRILNNGKFFSLKKDSPKAKQLTLRKTVVKKVDPSK